MKDNIQIRAEQWCCPVLHGRLEDWEKCVLKDICPCGSFSPWCGKNRKEETLSSCSWRDNWRKFLHLHWLSVSQKQKLSRHPGKLQHDPLCSAAGTMSCAAFNPGSDTHIPAHLWPGGTYTLYEHWVAFPNSAVCFNERDHLQERRAQRLS